MKIETDYHMEIASNKPPKESLTGSLINHDFSTQGLGATQKIPPQLLRIIENKRTDGEISNLRSLTNEANDSSRLIVKTPHLPKSVNDRNAHYYTKLPMSQLYDDALHDSFSMKSKDYDGVKATISGVENWVNTSSKNQKSGIIFLEENLTQEMDDVEKIIASQPYEFRIGRFSYYMADELMKAATPTFKNARENSTLYDSRLYVYTDAKKGSVSRKSIPGFTDALHASMEKLPGSLFFKERTLTHNHPPYRHKDGRYSHTSNIISSTDYVAQDWKFTPEIRILTISPDGEVKSKTYTEKDNPANGQLSSGVYAFPSETYFFSDGTPRAKVDHNGLD